MASPSSRRATKRRRSSITELAFPGIHTSRLQSLQKSEKCNPCVRYEMSPMSRAAHRIVCFSFGQESCRSFGQMSACCSRRAAFLGPVHHLSCRALGVFRQHLDRRMSPLRQHLAVSQFGVAAFGETSMTECRELHFFT